MKARISVLIITRNSRETIIKTVKSILWADEVVIADSNSTDKTRELVNKVLKDHKAYKIIKKEFGNDIGKQRLYGLKYVTGRWVLVLDSDEIVSKKLKKEILKRVKDDKSEYSAYEIRYQNYFLGRQVNYGGENYKMVRLFRKSALIIKPSILHNKLFVTKGKTGKLKGKIFHHSYRSIEQVFSKFTDYSFRMAKIKVNSGERSSLRKIFFYPLHMFWARFVEDKGYKDGFFRIPLDLGFAYMEFLTYFILFWQSIFDRSGRKRVVGKD